MAEYIDPAQIRGREKTAAVAAAAAAANMPKLKPEQYPKKEIITNTGSKETVYTSGPLGGQIVGQQGVYAVQAGSNVSQEAKAADFDAAVSRGETPVTPTDGTNTNNTVIPGSGGKAVGSDRTLAIDTFKNTLALFFGLQEMSKPWVNALYGSVSGFYNSGSTIDESLNLSLQDVRNNPELKSFTDRFGGIYALTDRLAKGEAIAVPTIAEYFKSEAAMGDVLREAGMGELATQDFLGKVLGAGKSVLEVTNLIKDTFASLDNAPKALKDDLANYFPGVSRVDMAKALLTGKEGADELNKKIAGISTLSAAKSQGVDISLAMAGDIAARGYDYNKSLTGFADVKRLERGQMLGKMSNIDFNQENAIGATFQSDVTSQDKVAKIAEEEANRFSGRSGRFASKNRAAGII